MNESELHKKLRDQILRRLDATDVPHAAAIITFCGIPGSGKTSLATRLARDLQAQYVQNDAIRLLARQQHGVTQFDAHPVSQSITRKITEHHANKLIVLDASIDRTWHYFLDHCKEINTTPIIVRIAIDPAEAVARLQKRGRHDDTELIEETDMRQTQFLKCKEELPATIEVTVPFDYHIVLDAVKQKLTRL